MTETDQERAADDRERERLDEAQNALDMSLSKVPGDDKIYISG